MVGSRYRLTGIEVASQARVRQSMSSCSLFSDPFIPQGCRVILTPYFKHGNQLDQLSFILLIGIYSLDLCKKSLCLLFSFKATLILETNCWNGLIIAQGKQQVKAEFCLHSVPAPLKACRPIYKSQLLYWLKGTDFDIV